MKKAIGILLLIIFASAILIPSFYVYGVIETLAILAIAVILTFVLLFGLYLVLN